MKIKSILALLAFLPALFSCQSEAPQQSNVAKKEFRVRASIDTPQDTRAAIEYGYGHNEGDEDKEIFTWVSKGRKDEFRDYITLFNLTKFSEFHYDYNAPVMYIDTIIGKKAEFAFDPWTDSEALIIAKFQECMMPGDIILAMVCEAHAGKKENSSPEYSNVISYEAVSHLYDQIIVENPTTATAMNHVHMQMRMYDIVKVDENGKIPDLHFKHISSIFRVTLQNKTGKPLFTKPSDIVFTAHSKDMSAFIFGYNFFSVVGNENDGFHFEENFPINETKTVWLSNKTTQKINEKSDVKIPLNDGDTYEFYAVVTPRIGRPEIPQEDIEKFTIDVYDGVESGFYAGYEDASKYTITIDDFNRAIEPGKRYWFRLTATDIIDGQEEIEIEVKDDNGQSSKSKKLVDVKKLMFTSEWTDKYGNKNNNGEDTSTDE